MRRLVSNRVSRQDNRGAGAVENGLLVALIAILAIGALNLLGPKIDRIYGCFAESLANSAFDCPSGGDTGNTPPEPPSVSLTASASSLAEGETALLELALSGGPAASSASSREVTGGTCPAGAAGPQPYSLSTGSNAILWSAAYSGCTVTFCHSASNPAGSDSACVSIAFLETIDQSPDDMVFPASLDRDPGQNVSSVSQSVTGLSVAVPASVTGGLMQINGGPLVSGATAQNGDQITLHTSSSSLWGGSHTVALNVGTRSFSWLVTTRLQDRLPDIKISQIIGIPVTPDAPGTIGPAVMTGFDGPLEFSVINGLAEVNGAPGVTSGTLMPADTVRITYTTPMSAGTFFEVSLLLGDGQPMYRAMTTDGPDSTPVIDTIQVHDVPLAQLATSPSIVPTGYNVPISISANNGAEISIAGGSWQASGTISPGQSYRARMMSSPYERDFTTTRVSLGNAHHDVIFFTTGW